METVEFNISKPLDWNDPAATITTVRNSLLSMISDDPVYREQDSTIIIKCSLFPEITYIALVGWAYRTALLFEQDFITLRHEDGDISAIGPAVTDHTPNQFIRF